MSLPVAGGMPSADRCLLCSAAARSLASRAASSLSTANASRLSDARGHRLLASLTRYDVYKHAVKRLMSLMS